MNFLFGQCFCFTAWVRKVAAVSWRKWLDQSAILGTTVRPPNLIISKFSQAYVVHVDLGHGGWSHSEQTMRPRNHKKDGTKLIFGFTRGKLLCCLLVYTSVFYASNADMSAVPIQESTLNFSHWCDGHLKSRSNAPMVPRISLSMKFPKEWLERKSHGTHLHPGFLWVHRWQCIPGSKVKLIWRT